MLVNLVNLLNLVTTVFYDQVDEILQTPPIMRRLIASLATPSANKQSVSALSLQFQDVKDRTQSVRDIIIAMVKEIATTIFGRAGMAVSYRPEFLPTDCATLLCGASRMRYDRGD